MFAKWIIILLFVINYTLGEKCNDKIQEKDDCSIHVLQPNDNRIACEFLTTYSSVFEFYFKPDENFDEITIQLYNTVISMWNLTPVGTGQIKLDHFQNKSGWNKIRLEKMSNKKYQIDINDKHKTIEFPSVLGIHVTYVKVSTIGSGSWSSSLCKEKNISFDKTFEHEFRNSIINYSTKNEHLATFPQEDISEQLLRSERLFNLGLIMLSLTIILIIFSLIIIRKKYVNKKNKNESNDFEGLEIKINKEKNHENYYHTDCEKEFENEHIYESMTNLKNILDNIESKERQQIDEDSPRYVALPKRNNLQKKIVLNQDYDDGIYESLRE